MPKPAQPNTPSHAPGRAPLLLASGSPRRRELLMGANLEFTVQPPLCEEPPPMPGEDPAAYARRAALAKARDVAGRFPEARVLGADTIVVLGREILGKPQDAAHALAMLEALTADDGAGGRDHAVITGCALIQGTKEHVFSVRTEVRMASWPRPMLAAYAARDEPLDKAGAYAIQGRGAFLVRELRGSYTNVVGLPLAEVMEVLRSWGVIGPRQG
jgi:septum formation protein